MVHRVLDVDAYIAVLSRLAGAKLDQTQSSCLG